MEIGASDAPASLAAEWHHLLVLVRARAARIGDASAR